MVTTEFPRFCAHETRSVFKQVLLCVWEKYGADAGMMYAASQMNVPIVQQPPACEQVENG